MTDQETKDYFENARSWALESDSQERRSRRLAWTVAGCAAGLAIVQGLVLFALLPLKSTETVMLLVDRTTGYVQEVDPRSPSTIRADDAMLQSLMAQYVTAREGFDRNSVQRDYRKAALWSSGSARASYLSSMSRDNAASPFNRFPSGEALDVEVKSVSPVEKGVSMVRFDTFLRANGGQIVRDGSWIAVVNYQFSDGPMNYEDRLLNPLGLQVTSYRRSAERPTEEATVMYPAEPGSLTGPTQ